MTAPLFLIAHSVRGEAAFDVATKMECPHCAPQWSERVHGCFDCDDLGYWWIIPTSGHRAFPFHYWPWDELACDSRTNPSVFDPRPIEAPPMPPGWPDHYRTGPSPKVDITTLFKAQRKDKAKPNIPRRL